MLGHSPLAKDKNQRKNAGVWMTKGTQLACKCTYTTIWISKSRVDIQ